MQKGRKSGMWIFLQNCHIDLGWFKQYEKMIDELNFKTHVKFRFFISTIPVDKFPLNWIQ